MSKAIKSDTLIIDNFSPLNKVNYQELIVQTLKEKYQSFFLGITVLLIFLIGVSATSLGFMKQNKASSRKNIGLEKEKGVNRSTLPSTYIIKEGDDLSKISTQIYGTDAYAMDIAKLNNIYDPDILAAGISIRLPSIAPLPTAKIVDQGEIDSAAAFDSIHTSPTPTK